MTQERLVWIGRVATGRHGPHRPALDPGHPRRPRPLRLPPGRPVLPRPAHLRRLLLRRLLEAAERQGLPGRARHGLRRWASSAWPSTRRSSSASGFSYAEGSFLWIVNHVFFQYYSLVIFIVSALVMVVVSYLTERAGLREDQRPDLRHGHGRAPEGDRGPAGTATDVVASGIVLALILAAYLYFTG
ncbi:MAG: hypothetical protein M0C28_07355 [Candidatus Moduliflexus flocculans]|nr:hypothetical protein [Candidatus Moduliflexus flocculans]